VFSLGIGALFFDVVVESMATVRLSLSYMLIVSVALGFSTGVEESTALLSPVWFCTCRRSP
jgi:hypothetical protein